MVRMLVADDAAELLGTVVLQRGLARQVGDRHHPAEPGFGAVLLVGTTRSGRSKAPVMISIRGPSMRRKLSGVPQSLQKSRSAIEEERKAAGLPRVHAKSLFSISAKEANGAPEAFWHIRQWQMLTFPGGADSAKRMAPHWQPPVRTGFVAVVMRCSTRG